MPTMETVIDPHKESVEVVTYDHFDGHYTDYQKIIECSMLTFVRLYDNGDGVYLDDEGLYSEKQNFWMHRNYPQPLVNIGVFVGTNDEGDTCVPSTPFPKLKKDIQFIGSRYALQLYMRRDYDKISTENGYEDYRGIFFPES